MQACCLSDVMTVSASSHDGPQDSIKRQQFAHQLWPSTSSPEYPVIWRNLQHRGMAPRLDMTRGSAPAGDGGVLQGPHPSLA